MADATWRAGFARLAPLNLTFEAWLYPAGYSADKKAKLFSGTAKRVYRLA